MLTGEVMSSKDCLDCGRPIRKFFVLGDLEVEVCDTCIAPFMKYFELDEKRKKYLEKKRMQRNG